MTEVSVVFVTEVWYPLRRREGKSVHSGPNLHNVAGQVQFNRSLEFQAGGRYLEAGEQCLREGIECAALGLRLVEVELPSKQLHAEQGKDDEEEEEEEQQGGNGLHGVQQGRHQIGQSCPMAEQTKSDTVTPLT